MVVLMIDAIESEPETMITAAAISAAMMLIFFIVLEKDGHEIFDILILPLRIFFIYCMHFSMRSLNKNYEWPRVLFVGWRIKKSILICI